MSLAALYDGVRTVRNRGVGKPQLVRKDEPESERSGQQCDCGLVWMMTPMQLY